MVSRLHSYVEQVLTMYQVQEMQLLLSYFLSFFPLMVLDAISCHNLNIFLVYYHDTFQLCRTGLDDV